MTPCYTNHYFTRNGKKTKASNADYLYIGNINDFYKDAGEDLITDGIGLEGVYHWNNSTETWDRLVQHTAAYDVVIDWVEYEEEEKKKKEPQTENSDKWNIDITTDEGYIRTNEVPVSMEEVQEAITVMLKPSFFGKRLKKIEITRAEIGGIKRE